MVRNLTWFKLPEQREKCITYIITVLKNDTLRLVLQKLILMGHRWAHFYLVFDYIYTKVWSWKNVARNCVIKPLLFGIWKLSGLFLFFLYRLFFSFKPLMKTSGGSHEWENNVISASKGNRNGFCGRSCIHYESDRVPLLWHC